MPTLQNRALLSLVSDDRFGCIGGGDRWAVPTLRFRDFRVFAYSLGRSSKRSNRATERQVSRDAAAM